MAKPTVAEILQASLLLLQETNPAVLLEKIASLCLEQTHANRCLVLENQEGKLLIQADVTHEGAVLTMQNIPIEFRSRIKRTFILSEKLPVSIIDAVLPKKQPLLVEDFSDYSDDAYIQNFKPSSIYCFPVSKDGRLLGIIYLEHKDKKKSFSQEERESLAVMSDSIAIALSNAEQFLLVEKKNKELEEELYHQKDRIGQFQQNVKLLGEIGQDITANRSIEEITSSVYENVNTLMDAPLFSIGIYDPETRTLNLPSTIEKDKQLPPHNYPIDEDGRLATWCFKNDKEVFINNFHGEFIKYFPHLQPPSPKVGADSHSIIYLPIYTHDNPIGVITVQSFRKYAYSEYHLSILRNLAIYVAIALENAEAYQRLEKSREEVAAQTTKLEAYSKELSEQKEHIANAYQDFQVLAKLGREITSNIKVKPIVRATHQSISQLMDASIFTVGTYDKATGLLEMPITIEDGEELAPHSYSINDNEHRMAVWCFRNAKEAIIHDYKAEYNDYFPDHPLAEPKVGELPNSLIYLPIFSQGEVIGVLTVQTLAKAAYNDYHLSFLKNIAIYLGIALENAEAYREIEKSKSEIEEQRKVIEQSYQDIKLLGEIGQDIIANLDVEKIVETVYENVNNLMDAPIFSIGMYNAEKEEIEVTGSIENYKQLPYHSYSVDKEDSLSALCFQKLTEIHISDCLAEFHNYLPDAPLPKKPDVGDLPESIIYLPLVGKADKIGVLTVQSFRKHAYEEKHLNILRNLAIYISIALENAEAYRTVEQSKTEIASQGLLLAQSFQSMKLLGEIGQAITSNLSVEKIIETVYESINNLLDASVFWIGIHNKATKSLEFRGGKEEGQIVEDFSVPTSDKQRLATWCFRKQKNVFINDIDTDYQKYLNVRATPLVGKAPESIIYIPLSAKGEKVGVMTVQSFQKNAYTSHHLDILHNLATYVCIGLENAQLYQNMEIQVEQRTAQVVMQKTELERQKDQLKRSFNNIKLLSQIGQDITGLLSTDEIIRTAYDNVNGLMDAATFGVGILDETKEKIIFRGAIENGNELPEFFHDASDDNRFSVWAIKNQEAVIINDFLEEYHKYIPKRTDAAAGEEPESLLYLPLRTKNGDIGVITVQSFQKSAYNAYHLDILQNLAVYIAIAVENAEAYRSMKNFSKRLEKANQNFTSSINYAKRIQEAILPSIDTIRHYLPESFVLFRPRDIVSGDFYWFHEQYGKVFIAAIDCTGHGVPGAFMSMIGNDLLNEIVLNVGIEEPDYILSELHIGVRSALRQETTDNRDGMDIAICMIDKIAGRLDFAGAKRPLVYMKDGEAHILKGTPSSIGGQQHKTHRRYEKKSISTAGIDAFYIFSDGYQDQFGGEHGKKFRSKQFRDLLLKIHKEPMAAQGELLDTALLKWRGNIRQIDDVLVMGFKL